MKLYEFEFKKGKIEKNEYEVVETAKMYTLPIKMRFDSNYNSRISKEDCGKVFSKWFGLYFFTTNSDIEEATKIFIQYYKDIIIPSKESAVREANLRLKESKEAMENLNQLLLLAEMKRAEE